MSKLGCVCGHVIADNTNSLPYKGQLLKDQDWEPFWDTVAVELAAFADAVAAGKRQEWIDKHFLSGYPRDLPHADVISDYLINLWCHYRLTLYECESCGRLKIQESAASNVFLSYTPGDGIHHGVLASEHNRKNGRK